jgi:hypothetical protein
VVLIGGGYVYEAQVIVFAVGTVLGQSRSMEKIYKH